MQKSDLTLAQSESQSIEPILNTGDTVTVKRNENGIIKHYQGVIFQKVEHVGFNIDINGTYCYAWFKSRIPRAVADKSPFFYE